MKMTNVFNENILAYNAGTRIIANKGGTRSSKTWSLMQLLYLIAARSAEALLISVVSESVPHLKRGCIRDFKQMLEQENLWDENAWNISNKILKVGQSQIEFFSADSPSKVRGPARDILYVNECNNIDYETIRQLMVRTRKTVFLDYNPCEDFWVDQHILSRSKGIKLIHSTYKDNDFLTPEQVEEIEANQHDLNWWNVFGLGITGNREGLCIKNWKQVDRLPAIYKARYVGIDFGFTNDPTTIIDVRLAEGQLWVDEVLYKQGMTNPMIVSHLDDADLRAETIVADSAEPKSIAELRNLGLLVEGANKGADSIKNGIDILNRYTINVSKRSLNLIAELRSYKWKQDTDGKLLNQPIDRNNHAIDALRYVALNKLGEQRRSRPPKVRLHNYE